MKTIVGDCQEKIEESNDFFDWILAIHVLEHLPDLPAALHEIRRVLKPGGKFIVVIPCEGGIAYGFARTISARRIFEKKYHQDYDWFIRSEHINYPDEIIGELEKLFKIEEMSFFPLKIPNITMNLCVGMVMQKKEMLQ